MKKRFSILLIFAMLMGLVACGSTVPKETTQPTQTEEPEEFVSTQIVQGGATNFVIVHDGGMGAQNLANQLKALFASVYGIQMQSVFAGAKEESAGEIVVGNARDIAQKTVNKLAGEFDFAMKVEQEKLVLCATNELSYAYLGEYLKREVFVKNESQTLTLDSDDNILHSKSHLMESTFVDYWMAENTYLPYEEHFLYQIFQNADTVLPYRIYVPFNYTPEKRYPLMLNLHGAGLRGNDNQSHLSFIDTAMKDPQQSVDEAIIIFPQCPENQLWVDSGWSKGSYDLATVPESNELKAVVELIGRLQETYSIDENRIYAIGYSMGGYGTWNLLMNHPDLFAAGVPMCGAGDPNKASAIKDIPVWAVHGALDPTVPVAGSRDMAAAMEAVGAKDFHYTEIPNAEHNVWNYTYANAEILVWLFNQKKA